MIKKLIITYRTSRNERNRKPKAGIEYKQSKHIGIIIHENFENEESINKVVEELKDEHKKVSKIYFLRKPQGHRMSPWFKPSQVNFIGQIKSPELDHFLKQDLDFLLCFDESNNYLLDYIISISKAPARIGVMKPERKHYFEMMVQVDDNHTFASEEILKYLKKI
ncbi:MAG: DUF6913 domain-containing protein [Bacteroidota bacterium]